MSDPHEYAERHEYAQPDSDDVPFDSIPVQDNDEDQAEPDAENDHPDELAGEEVEDEYGIDIGAFDDEPDEDEDADGGSAR